MCRFLFLVFIWCWFYIRVWSWMLFRYFCNLFTCSSVLVASIFLDSLQARYIELFKLYR